ncbi:hypothetical protein OG866_44305 [Streptomyces sp. NBC_00663]|uniref:TRADD-N-associated membrane domain-containing protein n=1 Tax=Streptomyces sp. NBC_00663 TaxID=2975801 RepID=UPI002E328616|nr:hypothetical protein [Streptomyces sp. NBC_00663]
MTFPLGVWLIGGLENWDQRAVAMAAAASLLAGGGALAWSFGRLQRRRFIHRYTTELKAKEQAANSDRAESEQLELVRLWETTSRRLDLYHQIATRQAEQSFRHAQIAMAVGFATIVVAASIAALAARTTAGSIVSGVLGATGAAMAAYIGRTFVRSREVAATHLRSYFLQPLEFSRYLAAERLIGTLTPEARPSAVDHLAQAIILGRVPGADAETDTTNGGSADTT